jgi:hypothetical protein
MPTTASGTLSILSKNLMLNEWRLDSSRFIVATNDDDDLRSDAVSISWSAASNGKISISTPVTLTVDSGSDGDDAIKWILVTNPNVNASWILFELDTAIEFPAGGSLIINELDIELQDPE